MTITIGQTHDGLNRMINVSVRADQGKQLVRVETRYDGFVMGNPTVNPPASAYDNSYKKQEGIAPGWEHTVVVTASHGDGTSDSAQKKWRD